MKKIVSFILAGLFCLLASCGNTEVHEMTREDMDKLVLYEQLSGEKPGVVPKETGLMYHFYPTVENGVTHVIYSVDLQDGAYYRVEWASGPEREITSLYQRDYIMDSISKSQLEAGDLFSEEVEAFYAGTSRELYMKITNGKALYSVYASGFLPDAKEVASLMEEKLKNIH